MWPQNNAAKKRPIFMNFVLAGMAGAASTTIIHPFYILNNCIAFKSCLNNIKTIIKKERSLVLSKGIGSELVLHVVSTTVRIGVYSSLNDIYKDIYKELPTSSYRAAMGIIASTLSTFLGPPSHAFYTILTDPKHKNVTKKSMFNIIKRKIQQEGFLSLCRLKHGRKTASNIAQLSSYIQSKHHLTNYFEMKDDKYLYALASTISSFVKAAVYIPLKYIELHFEKLNCSAKHPAYFSGFFHHTLHNIEFRNSIRHLHWSMVHTILTFVILEEITNLYAEYVLGDKSKHSGLLN